MLKRASVLLAVILAATSVAPAAAQDEEVPDEFLDEIGTTRDEVAGIEPNDSWDPLGLFSDDALRIIGAATEPATGDIYAFGDSKDAPPIIEPSGTVATGVGSMLWQLPSDWTPPTTGLSDSMAFASTPTPVAPGSEVLLFWAEMDGDYDFTSGLTLNEGFPITVPGLPVWNSSFAGDTWEGANVIPNAVYDGTTLTFDVKQYEPPQQFPLIDVAGFYYRAGNVMAMAVDAAQLAALVPDTTEPAVAPSEGVNTNLLYTGDSVTHQAQSELEQSTREQIQMFGFRMYVHIAVQLFTPGLIFLSSSQIRVVAATIVLLTTVGLLTTPLVPTSAAQPEAEPDPEPQPDPAPEAADPEPAESDVASGGDPDSTDDGSSLFMILLIVAGIIVLLVGLLLLSGRDDEDDEDDDDHASTPPPLIASSTEEDTNAVRPIIFVPGIMASAIAIPTRNGPQTVWPPVGYDGDPQACFEALQATHADRMQISEITSTGLLPFIHLGLLGFLDGHGYKRAPADGRPANCYVHAYNWLRPCKEAGEGLEALIARATAEHGRPPSIIAHSMGGLVTRSALLGGGIEVDKVVFCASPHYGAPMAYFSIHPDIPYAFVPGPLGTLFNAAYATATSGSDSDISFADDDSWDITKGAEFAAQTLEKLAETAAHAAFSGSVFDNHLKLVSRNATGVFELLPDELYFEHVNPTWPVVTHKQRWFQRSHGYERHDYVPRSPQEAYFHDNAKDIPALPPDLRGRIEEAIAFKRSISVPLPPGGDDRTIVVYGATHDTKCSVEMTDDGDADTRGDVEATLGGDQGGDGTVPRESGRGRALWHGGVIVERDDTAEHFMMTETARFHGILAQHIPPGGY